MTGFFEVIHREGRARLGRLRLAEEIQTPALFPRHLTLETGQQTTTKEKLQGKIVVLPHLSPPLQTPPEKLRRLQSLAEKSENYYWLTQHERDWAVARVLHPLNWEIGGSEDILILGCSGDLTRNPRLFLETIIKIKNQAQPDTALYTPALALPSNLATLVYLGVDLVDSILPVILAYQDIYLTNWGEVPFKELKELPCNCNACKTLKGGLEKSVLADHNLLQMDLELRTVRWHIRQGSLRNYVESRCRTHPWLTTLLRLAPPDYLEKGTPIWTRTPLLAVTPEALHNPAVKRFASRIQERYRKPGVEVLLLLPCSAVKPYSRSPSHQRFIAALGRHRRYVHEVILTSPLGVVPRELEAVYPAGSYDASVTGEWSAEEREWTRECLRKYLEKNHYKHILAHLEGAYLEICQEVEEELGLEFTYTSTGRLTSRESLENLARTLKNLIKKEGYPRADSLARLRAVADYQFTPPAGETLTEGDVKLASYRLLENGEPIAFLHPRSGLLRLGLRGAEKLAGHPHYKVKIEDFTPRGSILAPGVLDADPQIRPGDEVIIQGPAFLGVGEARMSGWEMTRSTRGIAVEIRHKKN